MKKRLILPLLVFLTSCSNASYKTYFSYEVTSSLYKAQIQEKLIDNTYTDKINDDYYFSYDIISTQDELDDYFLNNYLNSDEKENYKTLKDNTLRLYISFEIPVNYQYHPKQNVLNKEGDLLISENLYYLANRENIFYYDIYLEENSDITTKSTYSVFFDISKEYENVVKKDNLRAYYRY